MSDTFVRKPSLRLIICLIILPQISETIYSPALPDIAHSLSTTMSLTEWTLSIYFFGFALGVGVWGRVSDHIGRRYTAIIGLIIYVVMSLLCASSRTIAMLLLLRFFQAFGVSIGSVITQTILRDCFSGSQRNKIFSIVGTFLGLAPAIGPIIGGITVQYGQWRATFIVLTLAGLSTLIYTLWRLPETRTALCARSKVGYFALLKKMLCDRNIIGSILLVGVFNGILFSYYAHAPFIFINLFHLLPSHYGMLGIALALATSIGSIISYSINNYFPARTITRLACLLNAIAMTCYVIADLSHFITTAAPLRSIITIIIVMMVFYISFGLAIPNILSTALRHYKAILGSAGAILGLSYYVVVGIVLFGMGSITIAPVKAMALYFFILAIIMVAATYLLQDSQKEAG